METKAMGALLEFPAVIKRGQISHGEELLQWEGAKVQVSLLPEAMPTTDLAISDDIELEYDVYVPVKGKTSLLVGATLIDKGVGRPTLVFPEENSDA